MIDEKSLEELFVGNSDFDQIEKSQNVFCPFEAVGMVRQEIRHNHFLAYILDPRRPHGFGIDCLQAFMRAVAAAHQQEGATTSQTAMSPLSVHLMDLETARVRFQWRGIDLLVEVEEEKLVVAIELKVESGEHDGQLGKYRRTVEENWPTDDGWNRMLVFLTLQGDKPSDDGTGWLAVGLDAVAQELDSVLKKQQGAAEARTMLAAYIAMLRRHFLTDDHLEQLAQKLWNQHREALEFLADRRPEVGVGITGFLYDRQADLAKRMSAATGLTFEADESTARQMRFAITEWDDLPDFLTASSWTASRRLILLETEMSSDRRTLRGRLVLGPGEPDVRKRYYDHFNAEGLRTTNRREITGVWTRLATTSLARDLDEAGDPEECFENIAEELESYTRNVVAEYHAALEKLRS